MKKLRKWLKTKGGLYAILTTIALLIVALLCVMIGYVYSDLGGNWARLGEMFTNPFATTIYVVIILVALAMVYITIMFNRNKDI